MVLLPSFHNHGVLCPQASDQRNSSRNLYISYIETCKGNQFLNGWTTSEDRPDDIVVHGCVERDVEFLQVRILLDLGEHIFKCLPRYVTTGRYVQLLDPRPRMVHHGNKPLRCQANGLLRSGRVGIVYIAREREIHKRQRAVPPVLEESGVPLVCTH